ncbi:MAG: YafY family transcriptional regulator [Anaerolineae bacterium]|nr:YafY family transcriptional regulator [Anaerolineae bacterium]
MRADRLLAIILLLQNRGKLTALALADELGVSRRTILRDVEALSIAGIPLYTEGGHGGGIALDEHYRVTLTGLKEEEARSLFLASNARLLDDVGLGQAAERTLLKLFAALPALHQPSVDHIRQRILIDPVWWWHDLQPLPFWAELQQAVYQDRCIRVSYEHYDGELVERELEPYSLVAKASLWYLIARREGELRTYRVSRFQQVTLLDAPFQRAADFDLPAYWQSHIEHFLATLSEYAFTVRLDSRRLASSKWYTPGRTEILAPPGEDGWLTARFWVESQEMARLFVLSMEDQAVVVEPADLRADVQQAARAILSRYA